MFNPQLLSAVDRVRFAVGDTGDVELLADATYTALLAGVAGDETKTTILAADHLAVKYAQEPDKVDLDGGKTSAEWTERIRAWRLLAQRLRDELSAATVIKRGNSGTRRVSRWDDCGGSEYRRE